MKVSRIYRKCKGVSGFWFLEALFMTLVEYLV
jgi:hypothetical protein